jgi:hypothetical protein
VRASSLKGIAAEGGGRKLASKETPKGEVKRTGSSEGTSEKETPPKVTETVAEKAVQKSTLTMTEGHDEPEWRRNMERENDALIERMDDSQRSQERKELVEQLGPDVLDLISRIQGRRASAANGLERIGNIGEPSRAYAYIAQR